MFVFCLLNVSVFVPSREHRHFYPKVIPKGGSASSSAGEVQEGPEAVKTTGSGSPPAGSGSVRAQPEDGAYPEVGASGVHQEFPGGPPPTTDSGRADPDAEVEAAAGSEEQSLESPP